MKLLTLKSTSALALALVAGGVMATATPVAADNTTGKVEFNPGTLEFGDGTVTVPDFDFGKRNISSVAQTYDATAEGTLAVTDLRGTGAGWNVTVKQQDYLTSTTSGHQLTTAKLKLDAGTTNNSNGETVNATAQNLTVGSVAKVFDAQATQGNGISTLTWAKTQAHLEIPAGATQKAEVYEATLEWTLNQTP